VVIAGLQQPVKSARLLATGDAVKFQQDSYRVRLTGLPMEAPDHPITTIALQCDGEPTQDTDLVRKEKPRESV
jgi:alpha-L-fucosidase